jgi:hypothetical protein
MGTMLRESQHDDQVQPSGSSFNGQKDKFFFNRTCISKTDSSGAKRTGYASQVKDSRENTLSKIETEKLHGGKSKEATSRHSSGGRGQNMRSSSYRVTNSSAANIPKNKKNALGEHTEENSYQAFGQRSMMLKNRNLSRMRNL